MHALNLIFQGTRAVGVAGIRLDEHLEFRAEREVITLHRAEPVRGELLQWMNRVSDLLFAAALLVNRRAGQPETPPDYSV